MVTIREIIVETPQSDARVRRQARQVFQGILANQRRPLQPGAVNIGAGPVVALYMPTVLPNLIVGFIDGVDNPAMSVIEVGTIPRRYGYCIHYPFETGFAAQDLRAAHVEAQRLVRDGEVTTAMLISAMREHPMTTFVHEFTHYMDWSNHLPSTMTLSPAYQQAFQQGNDGSAYWNDPLERNAYYAAVLSKLDARAPEFFQVPFATFWQRAQTLFLPDFLNGLNQASRQRLISRLYQDWLSRR